MLVSFHPPNRHGRIFVLAIILFLLTLGVASAAQQVKLAWDPNTPAPEGYRVFQRVEGESFDYNTPVWPKLGDDPSQTTCLLENLADDTSYYFVVRAYVGSVESGNSNEEHYTTGPVDPVEYDITTDAGANGSIMPPSATVAAGASQSFSITAQDGYHIDDVWVDGASVGPVAKYTFNQVDADHNIRAAFVKKRYSISATADEGGTITPAGSVSVDHADAQTFYFSPSAGYGVADVLVDGESVGAVEQYTFQNVTTGHAIHVRFYAEGHMITATHGPNGGITPSGNIHVADGEPCSFTISPENGCRISDVKVDGVSVGAVNTYTFSNVDADHTITATFAVDRYTIQASAGEGGVISPSGNIQVSGGSDSTFHIMPNEDYELDDLIVDGKSVGPNTSYTFSTVDADHTITAQFSHVGNLPPVADAGPDQVVKEEGRVTLSGLNSRDLDDGIASYQWRQVKGTPVDLGLASEEVVFFIAPNVDTHGESLEFELTVTDFTGDQSSDRSIVNVTWVNEAPIANAGADQSLNEGSLVTLDAAGSMDPDDGIAGYQWLQVRGPKVSLSNPSSPTPSFKTPDVGSQGATLVFQLTVMDEGGLQDTDDCTVVVTWDNMEPVADAGPDRKAAIGGEVQLDGSRSMDPDGMQLKYQWRQSFGPPVILSDPTAVRPMFTVPMEGFKGTELVFELTVTDSGGLQGVDVCAVAVSGDDQSDDTTPPTVAVISHSKDTMVVFSTSISLYGRAHDDGQLVRVSWECNTGGSGEADGTTQWRIDNVALRLGTNQITITATDAAGNQQSKQLTVYQLKKSWWNYLKRWYR